MPRLEYDVVFNLNQSSTETLEKNLNRIADGGALQKTKNDAEELSSELLVASNRAESFSQEIGGTSTRLARFRNNTDETANALQRFQQSSRAAGRDTKNMSKIANNSNQILFSFGDAIQDGAQFQHGFASGARAIGNNITFASEQIAIAANKAGSFGGAMKSLAGSFIGPAGIILAINTAVTVLTVFGEELGFASDDADELNESLKNLNSSWSRTVDILGKLNAFGDDQFGMVKNQAEIREITEDIERQRNLLQQSRNIESNRSKIIANNTDLYGNLTNTGERLLEQYNKQVGNVASQETIQKRINELSKERQRISEDLVKTGEALADSNVRQAKAINNLKIGLSESRKEAIKFGLEFDDISDSLTIINNQLATSVNRQMRAQNNLRTGGQLQPPNIVGAAARQRAKERQQFFKELGISEVQFERSIANSKVQIHKNTEQAKTAITKRQARARRQLITQVAAASSAILTAAFGKSKEIRIAQALIDTYASAQAAYYSQLTASPDSPIRATIAAAAAVASGLARVATMRSIEPGSSSGSGGGGGGSTFSAGISGEGFRDTNLSREPDADTARRSNQDRDIVINLQGDLDDRAISIRAERGRKKRAGKAVRVQ